MAESMIKFANLLCNFFGMVNVHRSAECLCHGLQFVVAEAMVVHGIKLYADATPYVM